MWQDDLDMVELSLTNYVLVAAHIIVGSYSHILCRKSIQENKVFSDGTFSNRIHTAGPWRNCH